MFIGLNYLFQTNPDTLDQIGIWSTLPVLVYSFVTALPLYPLLREALHHEEAAENVSLLRDKTGFSLLSTLGKIRNRESSTRTPL